MMFEHIVLMLMYEYVGYGPLIVCCVYLMYSS